MTVESASFIPQIVPSLPTDNDQESEGAAHFRLIKSVLQSQFNQLQNKPISTTCDDLNMLIGVYAFLQASAGAPWANLQSWIASTFTTAAVVTSMIQTAFNSSPAIGGTPTVINDIPIADNTRRIASTAFVQGLLASRTAYTPVVLSGASGAISGTFTTPVGVRLIRMRMTGPGGGGGAGSNIAPTAGGTGATATQFGNAICGPGQGGGPGFTSQGSPGSGGAWMPSGTDWTTGIAMGGNLGGGSTGGAGYYPGGEGGDSLLGPGGKPYGQWRGGDSTGYGGGGAGGSGWPSNWMGGAGGGAGAYAELWYTGGNVVPAYYFQCGPGGAGGTQGNPSGFVGGNGGPGLIIVEMW